MSRRSETLPDHFDAEVFQIGTIDFSTAINEKEIGIRNRYNPGGSIGVCKIEVYENEGQIPHFHITSIDKKFSCCVRIFDNHFFQHGKHQGALNSNQCVELDAWLRLPFKTMNQTNWGAIATSWFVQNPYCRYPKEKQVDIQPDYTTMTEFRSGV